MILSRELSKNIALYFYNICHFYTKSRLMINELGLAIELKNNEINNQNCIDFHQVDFKTQVPCLCIEDTSDDTQRLYKAEDIINYLAQQQNELFRLALTA